MTFQEEPCQPKERLTRYLIAIANKHPIIKKCSKHINDHQYKFYGQIGKVN